MMNGPVEHSSSSLFFEQKKNSPPIVSAQIENDMLGGLVEAQKGVPFNGCQGALSLVSV